MHRAGRLLMLMPPTMATPEIIEPIAYFKSWMDEAVRAKCPEPTRMALGTVDERGFPNVRMVLLKGCDERGFVFYTNLNSPKVAQLRAHPRAALCFHWAEIERQIRIEGAVTPVTDAEADAYFASRARLSQLGAWASKQSEAMEGYWEFEKAMAATTLRFAVGTVPRPPHWSGFRVAPERIEFWHQKPFRHHERQRFTRTATGGWAHEWLYP